MNNNDSIWLGILTASIFSGPIVWLIALIADKPQIRKGAFIVMIAQAVVAVIAVIVIHIIL